MGGAIALYDTFIQRERVMGLDFRGSSASWSYSGFNSFRTRLAKEIDISLQDMEGFGGDKPWSEVNDPIVGFLHHSDCEGELTAEQCATIAPRLAELVIAWGDDDYDKRKALKLSEDMIALAKAGEALEFI